MYTRCSSNLDPIMRWKPQNTTDLLYQDKVLYFITLFK